MEIVVIKALLIGTALAVTTPVVFAQIAPITQFVTPKVYRTLSQDAREKYVAGVIDSESAYSPQSFISIRACLKGTDLGTVTAAVDHLILSQPDEGDSMPVNVHNAVAKTCR